MTHPSAMSMPGARLAVIGLLGAALLSAAPAALASHSGTTVDCGDAGTFTARATQTAAGSHQAPEPSSVLIFEEGGSLTVFEFWVNGQRRFQLASTGRAANAVEEVRCSFTNGAGSYFEIVGILTTR